MYFWYEYPATYHVTGTWLPETYLAVDPETGDMAAVLAGPEELSSNVR